MVEGNKIDEVNEPIKNSYFETQRERAIKSINEHDSFIVIAVQKLPDGNVSGSFIVENISGSQLIQASRKLLNTAFE